MFLCERKDSAFFIKSKHNERKNYYINIIDYFQLFYKHR